MIFSVLDLFSIGVTTRVTTGNNYVTGITGTTRTIETTGMSSISDLIFSVRDAYTSLKISRSAPEYYGAETVVQEETSQVPGISKDPVGY